MPDIEIDGQRHTVQAGENLLQACLSLGLDLPYFCWHPSLGSVGACRQCAVIQYQNPADTQGRLVMACMTPVAEGLRVSLRHPEARRFRADIIELLMTHHPHDCPVCEEGGECHLQDMTEMSGHTFRAYRGRKRTHRNQDLGPFINHEMNRCIACYRCVRYYQDYCGGDDLQAFAAHHHVYFGRHEDGPLENEFSGNLVEVCPTGVFTDRTLSRHYTRKWDLQTAPSICVHCALGCNTSPGERYGSLRRVVNRYHGEINGYFLCDRGRFGYEFVNGDRRIRAPRLHEHSNPEVGACRAHFSELLKNAQGVIGIGSPRASLEANFALRELVGADRFHWGVAAEEDALLRLILDILRHSPLRIASLREAERADAVFVLGEDVTQTAPRLALSLRQATRNRAGEIADALRIPRWQDAAVRVAAQQTRSPLVVASCAPTRLDDAAELLCRGRPAELAGLGLAVAHRLNPEAPAPADASPETQAQAARIADFLAAAKRPLIVSGTGGGSANLIRAAAQVAWALASRRESGSTDIHFVLPECNSLGLALLGGRPLDQAFAAIGERRADTLVILENDLYRRAPKAQVDHLLQTARQVVVLDHSQHQTAGEADLMLPCASFAEAEGSLVSSEGRGQRYFAVYPAEAPIQPAWRWLGDAAGKNWRSVEEAGRALAEDQPELGAIAGFAPSASFRNGNRKIPRQTPRYSGRTAMLAHLRIHEPKQPADEESALAFSMEGSDTPPSALRSFAWSPGWNSNQAIGKFQEKIGGPLRGGDPGLRLIEPDAAARFVWFAAEPMPPVPADTWQPVPLYHIFGSEELSQSAPAVAQRAPLPYLALNPADAAALGLQEGELADVELADTRLVLPVRMLSGLPRNLVGLPKGLPGVPWLDFSRRIARLAQAKPAEETP